MAHGWLLEALLQALSPTGQTEVWLDHSVTLCLSIHLFLLLLGMAPHPHTGWGLCPLRAGLGVQSVKEVMKML